MGTAIPSYDIMKTMLTTAKGLYGHEFLSPDFGFISDLNFRDYGPDHAIRTEHIVHELSNVQFKKTIVFQNNRNVNAAINEFMRSLKSTLDGQERENQPDYTERTENLFRHIILKAFEANSSPVDCLKFLWIGVIRMSTGEEYKNEEIISDVTDVVNLYTKTYGPSKLHDNVHNMVHDLNALILKSHNIGENEMSAVSFKFTKNYVSWIESFQISLCFQQLQLMNDFVHFLCIIINR